MAIFSFLSKSRLVLLAFGFAAVALSLTPIIVRWWVMSDACPRAIIGEGYFKDGLFWRITRAECGGDIGTVWQVHISAADTQPRLAFNAQNAPQPVKVEQVPGAIVILLSEPPTGTNTASVTIPIVPKGRPKKPVHFINGKER